MVDKWKEQKYIYKSKIEKKKEKPTYPFQFRWEGYEKHNRMMYADVILPMHKETTTVVKWNKSNVFYMWEKKR